jgi:hypothetical protein
MDNYEHYAVMVIITFGALAIAGLMAIGIAVDDKGVFLFAFAAALCGWISGHLVLFNKPRMYGLLVLAAVLLCALSIFQLVTNFF